MCKHLQDNCIKQQRWHCFFSAVDFFTAAEYDMHDNNQMKNGPKKRKFNNCLCLSLCVCPATFWFYYLSFTWSIYFLCWLHQQFAYSSGCRARMQNIIEIQNADQKLLLCCPYKRWMILSFSSASKQHHFMTFILLSLYSFFFRFLLYCLWYER